MNAVTHRLLERARFRLLEVGADPVAGAFVCPMCLRLQPEPNASLGHFPAQRVAGWMSRTELICRERNSFHGTAYEQAGIDLLNGDLRFTFSAPGTGKVTTKGKLRADDEGIVVQFRDWTSSQQRGFDAVRTRSETPGAFQMQASQPPDEHAGKALLSWSFLYWSWYAGYLYTASPGAYLARHWLQVEGEPLPNGVFGILVADELLNEPLPYVIFEPNEAVVATPDNPLAQVAEILALGVKWRRFFVSLPFANDVDPNALAKRLARAASLPRVGTMPVRRMFNGPWTGKGIHQVWCSTPATQRYGAR